MELHPGESIEYELAANLRKGIEYVGGTLMITNQRFLFHPHGFNIKKMMLNSTSKKSQKSTYLKH